MRASARVGLADVHPGQYLDEGTQLTTLQSVDDGAHVDFTVAQRVAAVLRVGDRVEVFVAGDSAPTPAGIVALDARIDSTICNAMVRAKIAHSADAPAPGASGTTGVCWNTVSEGSLVGMVSV